MTTEKRVCPMCRHEFCLPLYVVGGTLGPISQTEIVKCASCGERRHYTHWKTNAEHDAADKRVQQYGEAVASGEEPGSAMDRIFK